MSSAGLSTGLSASPAVPADNGIAIRSSMWLSCMGAAKRDQLGVSNFVWYWVVACTDKTCKYQMIVLTDL